MVKKYELPLVTSTHNRLSDPDLTEAEMEIELEKPAWEPAVYQMIAVSDADINNSKRYGQYLKMEGNKYLTTAGKMKYARELTAEEIAACYQQ
jgi:hypothetical protein